MKLSNTVVSPVIYKDKFLLIKRIKPPYKGFWSHIGGHIEAGEHIEDAIVREVKEETNLDVKFVALRGFVEEVLYNKNKKLIGHYLMWVCETRAKKDSAQEMNEGKIKWFTKQELTKFKEKITPSDFKMIEEFFLKKKKSLKVHRSHIRQDGKIYQLEYFGT